MRYIEFFISITNCEITEIKGVWAKIPQKKRIPRDAPLLNRPKPR